MIKNKTKMSASTSAQSSYLVSDSHKKFNENYAATNKNPNEATLRLRQMEKIMN